jgi:hypothetical protein
VKAEAATSFLLPVTCCLFILILPFFLRFIDQTLGTKFAIQFGVITRHPLLKTPAAISDLMFLTRDHSFLIRMGSTSQHNKDGFYHTFRNKENGFVAGFSHYISLYI